MNLGPVSFSHCRPSVRRGFRSKRVGHSPHALRYSIREGATPEHSPVSDDIRTPARPTTSRSTDGDLRTTNDVNAQSRSAGLMVAAERHLSRNAVGALPALRFEISEATHILRMSRAQLYNRIGEGAIQIQKD